MHYKFNPFTGRLSVPFTGRLSAPSPLEVPSKYGKGIESPCLQFIEGTKIAVTDPPKYSSRYAPVPQRLQGKMRLFQMPNGLPVHIRGGPVDKILLAITSAVCLIGFVDCFRVYYTLAYPTVPE